MRRVEIEPRFDAWRAAARGLLAEGVPPSGVLWADARAPEQGLLPGLASSKGEEAAIPASGARVPSAFVKIARDAALHRDPERWPLLYRVLWRLTHGETHLLEIEVDDDVRRMVLLEKAVRRDAHKMHAFVRFRRVEEGGEEVFVAWHRPDHFILEKVAPFFVERFGVQRWSILTPDASAFWDGDQLRFGPGVPRTAAPAGDELEDLWRTYYGSVFNPARINWNAMRAELPLKHWLTLPETRLIPELMQAAPGRVEGMIGLEHRPLAQAFFPPGKANLSELAAAVQECAACDLCERATRAVFGEGPAAARLLLVGEQPGDQEDLEGRPFVGPAGQVLAEALAEAGIAREEAYLTNAVKHFKWEPRGKRRIHRTPTLGEVAACRPWLEEEIARVRPEAIVCLGATAARALLGAPFRLTEQRGQVFEGTRWAPWLIATYHPSALLRVPDEQQRGEIRRAFLSDLGQAAARLGAPIKTLL